MNPRWPRLAAAGLGFFWFLQICGSASLNPMNTEWLFAGDWRQHWLGFLFFQREPWTFPLGQVPSLLYPIGTNIGFTDSNPFLAILVKPFAGILPAEYQLIGLWLASCFVLQGYVGAALASTVTKDPGQQVLGGYLFVLSPTLFARIGHDTLCAQWLLLGLLYLGIREYTVPSQRRRAPWLVTGAVMFAAAVHPYLAAMTWVLAQAVLLRLWRSKALSLLGAAIWMAISTAGVIAVWAAIGYLGDSTPDGSSGFGRYSADLLTLFNPLYYSRLIPELPSTDGQWEGFGFIGAGGLVALSVALVALVKRRPTWRAGAGIVVTACVLLGIYALSSSVRYAGAEVLNLEGLYGPLMPILKPFRSSGRFIWPVHYLVLVFGLWGVTRVLGRDRTALSTVLLACVVVMQAADVDFDRWWLKKPAGRQVATATFDLARGQYRHLALAPPQVLGACGDKYEEDYVYRFMLLANRLKLTFNSGIYARLDVAKVRGACESQNRSMDTGALDPETIYVAAVAEVERYKSAGAACGRWDGNWFCVSRAASPRFAAYIETGKDPGPAAR